MDDLLFLVQPDEIERDLGILHPEHPGLCLRERKEHAAVWGQLLAVHQSLCSFLGSVGQLYMNDGASWEGNRDQSRQGWIVSCHGIAGEREEENEEKDKWSVSLHGGILSASQEPVKFEVTWVAGRFEELDNAPFVSVILEPAG